MQPVGSNGSGAVGACAVCDADGDSPHSVHLPGDGTQEAAVCPLGQARISTTEFSGMRLGQDRVVSRRLIGEMNTQPVLLIHGGAWAMPDDAVAAHELGVANALTAGYALLERGATAVDAVEEAVAIMEDDETFDAGRGSFLTQDGRVQMDALLMNGENLRTGGVACVERLRNPIRAARLGLDKSPHVYFVGVGAERFARQHGMELCDNTELVIPREQERLYKFQEAQLNGAVDETFSGTSVADEMASHDTVGAVALDSRGHLAAGTSTGGTLNKAPGRGGDSSLIGCGCYADDLRAAGL